MEVLKMINGYSIYIGGTWCEVSKDGKDVFYGNIQEGMTPEQVHQYITTAVEFKVNDTVVSSYYRHELSETDRQTVLERIAEDYQCNIEDIEVSEVINTAL